MCACVCVHMCVHACVHVCVCAKSMNFSNINISSASITVDHIILCAVPADEFLVASRADVSSVVVPIFSTVSVALSPSNTVISCILN